MTDSRFNEGTGKQVTVQGLIGQGISWRGRKGKGEIKEVIA